MLLLIQELGGLYVFDSDSKNFNKSARDYIKQLKLKPGLDKNLEEKFFEKIANLDSFLKDN